MRTCHLILLLSGLLMGCSQNPGSGTADKTSDNKISKQIVPVAEKYIISQVPDAKKVTSGNGMITIGDEQKRYVLDPSKIFTGIIDDDEEKDAIVSLSAFQGQFQTVSVQLIILKAGREYKLAGALESDMMIISLKDRIITADVPEHSRNTPLFNCSSCWEVVKYRFRMGEFERLE